MIMNIYSVFDAKMHAFDRPFFAMTDEAAVRTFSDAVNDGSNPHNQWFRHPEDFSLFHVGQFNDSDGDLTKFLPKSLINASSLVALRAPDVGSQFLNHVNDKTPVA